MEMQSLLPSVLINVNSLVYDILSPAISLLHQNAIRMFISKHLFNNMDFEISFSHFSTLPLD